MRIVGGKLMEVCPMCGKIVRIDKPLLGSMHFCVTEEEYSKNYNEYRAQVERSKKALEGA